MSLSSIVRIFAIGSCIVAGTVSCSATGLIDCDGEFEYSSTSFTPEQQSWIQESSARWNTWVGYKLTSVKPGPARSYCYIDANALLPGRAGQEHSTNGAISIDLNQLKENNELDRAHFESVVMHEVGHGLGYHHIGANSTALMSPVAALDFTDLDRIECIKHNMCHTAELK